MSNNLLKLQKNAYVEVYKQASMVDAKQPGHKHIEHPSLLNRDNLVIQGDYFSPY